MANFPTLGWALLLLLLGHLWVNTKIEPLLVEILTTPDMGKPTAEIPLWAFSSTWVRLVF